MKYLEIAFLCFTFLFVALFAHPFLTYEFSTPKYFFLILFISIGMVFYLLRQWRRKDPTLYIGLPQLGWFGFGIAMGATLVTASMASIAATSIFGFVAHQSQSALAADLGTVPSSARASVACASISN